MTPFSRDEVEVAFQRFVAVGDSGDWNVWADLHTTDCVWWEHHLGVHEGREAIRAGILEVMKPVPMMFFPVEWHMIDGNRVVAYIWQQMPDPKDQGDVYRFGNMTVLEYAGEGQWSFQEDLYNPREAEAVIGRWLGAGGRLAAPLGAAPDPA